MIQTAAPNTYVVAALYQFAPLDDLPALQTQLQNAAAEARTMGSLLIAAEGINGTIAGSRAGIDHMLKTIRAVPGFAKLTHKESPAYSPPFRRMRVRIKREIVTMGMPAVDPLEDVGTYVPPRDWNALISQPDVITIDTRNDYEVDVGRFRGAIDPKTTSFRQLPAWLRANIDPDKYTKVAMYCTGGIRCEKSTNFMKSLGFNEVYHLQGGILQYLEDVPEEESLWEGACYIFDDRVTLMHGLEIGNHRICNDCGYVFENSTECHRCAAAKDHTNPAGPEE